MTNAMVFHLPGHEALAERIATRLDLEQGSLTVREFPDGETYVRGETPCQGREVILAANLFRPNAQLLPLIYCVRAIRVLGARRVFLISPYLPYMRQDARFQPGEVVTSRLFAQLLSDTIDGVITIDPHLHRYTSLDEIYRVPTRVIHAAESIAAWIGKQFEKPVIVGPDRESEQWVSEVAAMAGAPFVVLEKTRRGDRDVEIRVPSLDRWRGHTPVLLDDIISTAHTMIESVAKLRSVGFSAPVCVGVHAVFATDAYEGLLEAGADRVVTCNTIEHPSNVIDLTDALADGVLELMHSDASATRVRKEAT